MQMTYLELKISSLQLPLCSMLVTVEYDMQVLNLWMSLVTGSLGFRNEYEYILMHIFLKETGHHLLPYTQTAGNNVFHFLKIFSPDPCFISFDWETTDRLMRSNSGKKKGILTFPSTTGMHT